VAPPHRLRGFHDLFREALREIFIQRLDDLRLRAVALDDDRQGLEARERVVERRLADAAGQRFRAYAAQPFAEWRLSRRRDGSNLLREKKSETEDRR
jgi:hypothetical protein